MVGRGFAAPLQEPHPTLTVNLTHAQGGLVWMTEGGLAPINETKSTDVDRRGPGVIGDQSTDELLIEERGIRVQHALLVFRGQHYWTI